MNNNDTGMNGVPNGFNNMNGMGNNTPNNGMSPTMGTSNMAPDSLQGMSLGNVSNSNPGVSNNVVGNATNANMSPMMNTSESNLGMAVNGSVSTPEETGSSAPTSGGFSFEAFANPQAVETPISNPTIDPNVQSLGSIDSNPINTTTTMNQAGLDNVTMSQTMTSDVNVTPQGTMDPNMTFGQSSINPTSTPMNGNPMFGDANNTFGQTNNMNTNFGGITETNNMTMNSSMSNSDPMAMNGVNQMNLGMGQGTPNPFDSNANMNGMNNFSSIPTPPNAGDFNTSGNKKKGMSKNTILILVVLLIAIIGAGVYFVLNNTKKTAGTITLNDMQLELGSELSTAISDYATISGFDVSTCKLDTSKVDPKKMGAYDYSVTCGTTSKSAKIIMQDKTAPVVVLKEVMVYPGSSVKIEDFILSCSDASNCTYELEDKTQDLNALAQNEGTYQINLIVSDDYDNQTIVTLSLNVSTSAPVKYMYCTPSMNSDTTLNASVELAYNYGIDNNDMLSTIQKIQTYTYDVQEDYLEAKAGYNTTQGSVVFDDDEFIITVTQNLTPAELSTEFNVNPFPTEYSELRQFNLNQGISCKNR